MPFLPGQKSSSHWKRRFRSERSGGDWKRGLRSDDPHERPSRSLLQEAGISGPHRENPKLKKARTFWRVWSLPTEPGLEVSGVFVAIGTAGSTEIARRMGAELTEKGNIRVDEEMRTTIPGLYAAGDCTGRPSPGSESRLRGSCGRYGRFQIHPPRESTGACSRRSNWKKAGIAGVFTARIYRPPE